MCTIVQGCVLFHGEHLLFLMLVVIHLSTLSQLLVSRLKQNHRKEEGEHKMRKQVQR